jgi:hypothetical protein
LRQYDESDVVPAWRAMGRGLAEGGLLVEGTSDPLGRLLVVHRLRRERDDLVSEGVVFLASLPKRSKTCETSRRCYRNA